MLAEGYDVEAIVRHLRSCFSDLPNFDDLVGNQLRAALQTNDAVSIRRKKAAKPFFNPDEYTQLFTTGLLCLVELLFEVAHVLRLSLRSDYNPLLWTGHQQLLSAYPHFAGAAEVELQFLLQFRNAVKVALTVFPAHRNKARILAIAARLEGSHKQYITGTGQSIEVTRRVEIYEQEGCTEAEQRSSRERKTKRTWCSLGASDHDDSAGLRRVHRHNSDSTVIQPSSDQRSAELSSGAQLPAKQWGTGERPPLISLSNVPSHDFYPLELSCTRAFTDGAVFSTFENNGPPAWAESSLGFWSGGELAQELLTLLE
jgi:hypothetical protein